MWNLCPLSFRGCNLKHAAKKTQFDVDDGSVYIAAEQTTSGKVSEIEVFKLEAAWDAAAEPTKIATLPVQSPNQSGSCLVSFRYLVEERMACIILTSGDIASFSLNASTEHVADVEVVGTVKCGIVAAAWSPDDSLLTVVTGDEKLLQMTKDFDVLLERPLRSDELGQDQPVNVKWGSKATQFHGSLGRAAALSGHGPIGSSPDDDSVTRISWRGDGGYFVISSLDPITQTLSVDGSSPHLHRRRVLRIYNRHAELQSTSENLGGLEHTLSWRPSGNLIAASQRFGYDGGGAGKAGRHDIVFFERNGLKHGDFRLQEQTQQNTIGQWGYRVKELSWSCDSIVLAIVIEREQEDVVQLWTMGNYHWYLKQQIFSDSSVDKISRFTSLLWHPEEPLRLILTTDTGYLKEHLFSWETCTSAATIPNDTGMVAVVDGDGILLTPFKTQNVPPPMSTSKITQPGRGPPTHLTISSNSDTAGFLWVSSRRLHAAIWDLQAVIPGCTKMQEPSKIWDEPISELTNARQIAVWKSGLDQRWTLAALGSKGGKGTDLLHLVSVPNNAGQMSVLPACNGRIISGDEFTFGVAWQSPQGDILRVPINNGHPISTATFSVFCTLSQQIAVPMTSPLIPLFIGLSSKGLLLASAEVSRCITLATNATSFIAAGSFLIYTTTSHEVVLVPLVALWPFCNSPHKDLSELQGHVAVESGKWEKRRVERGSRIVTCIPSAMRLVLQMPRGNLETIHPRALVMESVRSDIKLNEYRSAFLTCRKHRIDLKVIIDYDIAKFLNTIPLFVEQVHEAEYLNLFLSALGCAAHSLESIAIICDTIRLELEVKDLKRYIEPIITAHVVKTPPDYESALQMLLRLKADDPVLVETAIKYVIFLADAEKLFDTALGMYDFSLVLLIAQYSKRDPREYLPFLRELRTLPETYQKFRIDEHLKRHSKALLNLYQAGSSYFTEAIAYVEKYQLYREALTVWKKRVTEYETLLDLYGEWMFEKREFKEAALAFSMAGKQRRAMVAYEKCYAWRELFSIAHDCKLSRDEIVELGRRVGETLVSRHQPLDASRVFLDYCEDVPEAVTVLVQNNEISEALRIATLHLREDLVSSIVLPGALEIASQVLEDIQEMNEQLTKQVARWQELQVKKTVEPDAFYRTEDASMQNVDVMTDASVPTTTYTRYTTAPTQSSKRTGRSRRKLERKHSDGKKGTVDEADYLLGSITKLSYRLSAVQGEGSRLLPQLAVFSIEHRRAAEDLERKLELFQKELQTAVDLLWTDDNITSPPGEPNTVVPPEKMRACPPKPVILKWNVDLLM